MKLTIAFISFWLGCLMLTQTAAFAGDPAFPGRELFRDVPIIEIDDLYKRFDEVILVDVRTEYEYYTLRINGAVNVSLSDSQFSSRLKKLKQTTSKPLVFYCNGRTCLKSYQAARKARLLAGITNYYVFDAGVFDWAKRHPDQAILLGKSPIDVTDLISDSELTAHLIDPMLFREKINDNVLVLDVRDRLQRAGTSLFGAEEGRVGLDETDKLAQYVSRAKRENKTLLIYDAVGKQVRWLQYYLKKEGVKDYYFMKGGAEAYYKAL